MALCIDLSFKYRACMAKISANQSIWVYLNCLIEWLLFNMSPG